MRPTTKDLARAAGVSLATVDRVLNGRAGVRKPTVDAVNQAIDAPRLRAQPLGRQPGPRAHLPLRVPAAAARRPVPRHGGRAHRRGARGPRRGVRRGALPPGGERGAAPDRAPPRGDRPRYAGRRGADGAGIAAGARRDRPAARARRARRAVRLRPARGGRLRRRRQPRRRRHRRAPDGPLRRRPAAARSWWWRRRSTPATASSAGTASTASSPATSRNLRALPSLETHGDAERTRAVVRRAYANHPQIVGAYVLSSEARVALEAIAEVERSAAPDDHRPRADPLLRDPRSPTASSTP